jgi:FlgD Ig-like domain/Right handed beta helix region
MRPLVPLGILILFLMVSHNTTLAETLVVYPDGTGAFPTIQAAVKAANDGDTIALANGTFTGEGNRDVDYSGKAIIIRSQSGNPTLCRINCEGNETNPHRGFSFLSGEGDGAALFDLTVTGGYVTGTDPYGGAVLCGPGTFPRIEHCIFRSNHASLGGGLMGDNFSWPRISNCEFILNTATAGAALGFRNSCSPVVGDCKIRENRSVWGGALFFGDWDEEIGENGNVDVVSVRASEQVGGAQASDATGELQTSHIDLKLSVFQNNRITGDGPGSAIYFDGPPNSWLNIGIAAFLGNGGDAGVDRAGAIYFRGHSVYQSYISFVTFAENDAGRDGDEGSCIVYAKGALEIVSCLMAANADSPILCDGDECPDLVIECSDLFGNQTGDWTGCIANRYGVDGNFGEDPLFCDPPAGDFRLDTRSPCMPDSNICGYLVGAFAPYCTAYHSAYLVNPEGTGDFATIQAAVNAALDYDVIELTDGIFFGEGNRDIDLKGKKLVIRSKSRDPAACVIDCQGSELDPHRGFCFHSGEGPSTHIEGLTIKGGYITEAVERNIGGAIVCDSSSPRLSKCVFHSNWAHAGGGIGLLNSFPIIENCTIAANRIGDNQGRGAGVYGANAGGEIRRTIIAGNVGGQGIYCDADCPDLVCTDIFGNDGGDWVGSGVEEQLGINGNFSAPPLFCDPMAADFCLAKGSPGLPPYNQCNLLIGALGVGCILPSAINADDAPVRGPGLIRGFPNPASLNAEIVFDLPAAGAVRLAVFDATGRVQRMLLDDESIGAGRHKFQWDGRDEMGVLVPSGIYFYQLDAESFSQRCRMVLIR